ncbi:hypothetical protein OsI_09589 [Oryza sativa Indica Group]|uniref:Uncharacterized protein n=1 Tax=Oryza sativa subsp. indica TaxID=39946 RepID=B8AKZ2_ORYSI|nr:hypothetical protein OsI_09589 [Oryza sativa Indica Group]
MEDEVERCGRGVAAHTRATVWGGSVVTIGHKVSPEHVSAADGMDGDEVGQDVDILYRRRLARAPVDWENGAGGKRATLLLGERMGWRRGWMRCVACLRCRTGWGGASACLARHATSLA